MCSLFYLNDTTNLTLSFKAIFNRTKSFGLACKLVYKPTQSSQLRVQERHDNIEKVCKNVMTTL